MKAYAVTVYFEGFKLRYPAIGPSSCAVMDAAIDRFGTCAIAVHPIDCGGPQ